MSVLATIEPANLKVDAGAETSLLVRVRNRGTIVDRFDIAVVGPTAPWATVDPPNLRLFPDKEGDARVTFRPPRAPDPAADTYPFGVAVRAASDAASSTVEEGRIVVAPFIQLTSEIVPQTSRGSRSGSHDLTVHNVGNTVAEVTVKASDPDRLLDFEVIPQRAGLRPGGSATVHAKVKPRTTFLMGPPKRIPFAIQIDEPTAGSYQVPATLEQRAIIPGWVRPAAGLAVAAIAAILVLPGMLGFTGDADASPSLAAVASSPPPPATLTPPTEVPSAPPPPTEGPSPTPTLGPPDTLVAAGDESALESGMVTLICAQNSSCRNDVKDRILLVLGNLQGKASGARLTSFGSTPPGTLPVKASWNGWHYPYSALDGSSGNAVSVAIDLAPTLLGAPSYALVTDESGQRQAFVIPGEDAVRLRDDLYLVTIVVPTPPPDPGGGGFLFTPIYLQEIGGIDFGDIVFAAEP
ncbi:MAG TPA: hypothetical protein VMQ65_10435 [Candidatus Limnocylindria bacterium]|nr:hypothetical protein [Candidatus Limnocylindria bacterium]